jgi:chromosome segregation ATPase
MDCAECKIYCLNHSTLINENFALKSENEQLKSQIAEIEVERDILKLDLSKKSAILITNNETNIKEINCKLINENINLKNYKTILKKEINELRSELSALKKDFSIIQEDSKRKESKILDMQEDSKRKESKILDLQEDSKRKESKILDLQEDSKRKESKILDMQKELNDFKLINWSINMREGLKRVCKRIKLLKENKDEMKDFLAKLKQSDPKITLCEKDLEQILNYKDQLSDYLSSHVHQEYKVEIVNNIPEFFENGECISFQFADSSNVEKIKIDRRLINIVVFLIQKGIGSYKVC